MKKLDLIDIQKALNVTLYTVFILLRHGKLKGFKHNGTWHIDPRDLAEYRKRNPVTPEGPADWRGIKDYLKGIK